MLLRFCLFRLRPRAGAYPVKTVLAAVHWRRSHGQRQVGLMVFCCVYFFAATQSRMLLKCGVVLAALLLNGPFSFWGNYLPRMYPTHLRGAGESFALNIGARVIGASAAVLTTQIANVMPGAGKKVSRGVARPRSARLRSKNASRLGSGSRSQRQLDHGCVLCPRRA